MSKFSVYTDFVYRAGLFIPNDVGRKPIEAFFRLDLPYVGPLMAIGGLLSVGTAITFYLYSFRNVEAAKSIGHWLLRASLVVYIAATVVWVSDVN